MILKSTKGVLFEITDNDSKFPLGEGTFGTTYKARRVSDNLPCALKRFKPQKDPMLVKLLAVVRKNIEKLSKEHIKDYVTGKRSTQIIDPLDENSLFVFEDGTFGYAMELVDTKKFVSIKTFRTNVQDVRVVCKAIKNFARAMRSVHLSGWCYKDISSNNVYFDPQSGDVRIIDCDNVSVPKNKTVLGTPNFIAPEVYETATPDMESDFFSMALVLYTLCTGAHPLLGKKVLAYLDSVNGDLYDRMPIVYGRDAVFVFDPVNKSNEIRRYKGRLRNYFDSEISYWETLPDSLRNAFIKTFSDGIKPENKHMRTSDSKWESIADLLIRENTIKCEHCKKYSFSDRTVDGRNIVHKRCWFCDEEMPFISEPYTAVFSVKRNISNNVHEFKISRKQQVNRSIHPHIPELSTPGWLQVKYYEDMNILVAINNTQLTWKYRVPGHQEHLCQPGGKIALVKGTKININRDMVEMVVKDIQCR